jgi:RNA polymerase sigma factor (sigma-70 family)
MYDPEVSRTRRQEVPFAILPAVPAARGPSRACRSMPEPPETPPLDMDAKIAAAYHAHYRLLEYIAVQKFRVPEEDVRGVIHEVFVAFIRSRAKVYDERAWLVGAMCNHCRLYWRTSGKAGRPLPLEDDSACDADDVAQRVDVSALLRRMPRRCREVLHLRFFEEYSSEEIAVHYETTVQYARKMVYRCVCAARTLLARIAPGKGTT